MILVFAGIVTAVGWNIYRIQSEYQSGEAVYDELEQYAPTRPESNLSLVSSQSGEDTSQGDTGNQFGYSSWIRCEGTGISYPVVQSGDIYSTGVITAQAVFFWTAEMHRIFPIRIYGHHMKYGKMSSVLLDYKKQAFYEEHPEMELITPEHTYTIQLFAGYVANVQDDAWQIKL